MIATRNRAYAERVPQAEAVLSSGRLDKYGADRALNGSQLDQIESSQDVAALGTAEERDQWQRITRLEAALLTAPNDDETNVIREKTRLAKGVLFWRLAESFKARVWNERRTLKDLDQALREAQNRWVRVEKARGAMPMNTGQFAERVAALRARLDGSQQRLAGVAKMQNGLLEGLARQELEQQKERIGTYQIQARFALASIYDRAALGGGTVTTPKDEAAESQGELEVVPDATAVEEGQAPLDGAAPPPEVSDIPAPTNEAAPAEAAPATPDTLEPGVDTSAPPPGASEGAAP
jgi:hypothetical protein